MQVYGIIIVTLWVFFTPALANGLSLNYKWQQVSLSFMTLLSILSELKDAKVRMVSTYPLNF